MFQSPLCRVMCLNVKPFYKTVNYYGSLFQSPLCRVMCLNVMQNANGEFVTGGMFQSPLCRVMCLNISLIIRLAKMKLLSLVSIPFMSGHVFK